MQCEEDSFQTSPAKRRCRTTKSMLGNYIDNCTHILVTVFLADISVRLFKLLREYFAYEKYYLPEQRLWHITKRAFTYTGATQLLMLVVIFTTVFRSSHNPHFPLPPTTFLTFIPLYWAYVAVNFDHSTLDYAYWIRGNHGLDYAAGMASNYFHGYLKLTMPSYSAHPGIRERIEKYSAKNRVKFAVNRLVILVPNTMFVNSMIESKILEKAAPLECVMKNRAGVERPFKNDVYRFTQAVNGTYYYIALEGATPMLSFFEAMNFQLSSTWQMKEMQREILFKFYIHLKKLLKEWPETQQEVELVLYNAHTEEGRLQDVGEVLLAHISNLWSKGEA